MAQTADPTAKPWRRRTGAPVVIDCDDCAVRGPGCRDCVVSVLLGVPDTLLQDERAALEVLADVGLAPRLRLVPIRRIAGRSRLMALSAKSAGCRRAGQLT